MDATEMDKALIRTCAWVNRILMESSTNIAPGNKPGTSVFTFPVLSITPKKDFSRSSSLFEVSSTN
jgi:hypothetical protein